MSSRITRMSRIPGFKTIVTKNTFDHTDPAESGWVEYKKRTWVGLRRWWADEI